MSKHTPTPWTLNNCAFYKQYERNKVIGSTAVAIDNNAFKEIELLNAQANAEHIVHCVNLHDEMLEALKSFPGFTDDATVGDPWIERVRDLILKAEGK